MPYTSEKQRAYLHAKHPALAAKWDAETGGHVMPNKQPKRRPKAGKPQRAPRAGRL